MLDVRRLRLLHALSRHGTLAATARALSYTPSAVSQQLSALERDAGVVLLERHGRGVTLTEAAHALVRRTQRVLDELDAAEAELHDNAGRIAGTVRVAAFPTAIAALVLPAAEALRATAPAIELQVHEADPDDGLDLLRAGSTDVLIAYDYDLLTPLRHDGMERRALLADPVCVALPSAHPLAGADRIDVAALSDERWVAGLAGTTFGVLVQRVCRQAGFEPRIVHRASEFGTQEALVAAGLGIALLPALGRGENPAVRFVPSAVARHVSALVRRGTADRRAVREVLERVGDAATRRARDAPA